MMMMDRGRKISTVIIDRMKGDRSYKHQVPKHDSYSTASKEDEEMGPETALELASKSLMDAVKTGDHRRFAEAFKTCHKCVGGERDVYGDSHEVGSG